MTESLGGATILEFGMVLIPPVGFDEELGGGAALFKNGFAFIWFADRNGFSAGFCEA